MRILTANIALGIPGAKSPIRYVHSLLKLYGWKILPFLITKGRLRAFFNYDTRPDHRRAPFFLKYSSVHSILALIAQEKPDIIVLNELLFPIHKEPLEKGLRDLGFATIAWGVSLQPPDVSATTVVASRIPCREDGFEPSMTQLPEISGGAGITGIRLKDYPISIIGCHLSLGTLAKQQADDLAVLSESERSIGRTTILAGDFNERARDLSRIPAFAALGLSTVTKVPTTPLGLPVRLRLDYDHIFLPSQWSVKDTTYHAFGSDHLAVAATFDPH